MKTIFTFLLICISFTIVGQTVTANQVLEKAIAYHDPQGNWQTFAGGFTVVLETPGGKERKSTISINLPEQYFNVSTIQDGKISFREIRATNCRFSNEDTTTTETTTSDETCERTVMFKNYYTYLYGLPMKLKDSGTHIDPIVQKKNFKGKEYLVLKVTYDEAVGSDIWQFYFDPTTYAMEVYQFFKGPDETTGEYILLTDEVEVQGIKMPKDRAWYYNKDDGYLGTDKLLQE
ncbi:DUF6503 family protein [uncultured Dokdonia sp.]|uniref:DUF6503 family protein n=1 Tax=uncultured Dokdonia sp. TaxID=575653 RepID=UPI00260A4883|nr:DUF6503 family protein [uncultured Dokdonia sp.]